MSGPLAIAGVTAALKDLLNDGLLNHDLSSVGSFSITASPPDRITVGLNEPNQLNLFLYQVTPNPGWRNDSLPSRDGNGGRLTNQPLALDLHYMLSAYGSQDLNAEILLGYAILLLHETPVLSRAQLKTVLGAPSPVDGSILPSPFGTLSALDLADQIELIKISPIYMSTEELSKMWTAMQARYRPTMAYLVTTVLIQATDSTKAAPPVLTQGKQDTGPVATAAALPVLATVRPAASALLPAIRLGDDVLLSGTNLATSGSVSVQFQNARAELTKVVTPKSVADAQITAHIPIFAEDNDALHEWAVGLYSVSLVVSRPNLLDYVSNAVPVAFSPIITVAPQTAAAGDIDLTITCSPRLLKSQESRTQLVFGDQTFTATSIDTPVDVKQPTTLKFKVPSVVAGEYLVRLRVEGVDSIPAVFQGSPPKLSFDPQQKVTVS